MLVANVLVRSTADSVHFDVLVLGSEFLSHTNVFGLEVATSSVCFWEKKNVRQDHFFKIRPRIT